MKKSSSTLRMERIEELQSGFMLCAKCNIKKKLEEYRAYEIKKLDNRTCKTCKPYSSTISEKQKATKIRYRQNPKNRKRSSDLAKLNFKERRKTDPQFRIKWNLRSNISNIMNRYVKRGYKHKGGSAVKDLGCTLAEFIKWIESQWLEGMSWGNYGNKKDQWSMDHIIMLQSVDLTNREEFIKVSHYTNIRPMWHVDNVKRNKTDNL